MFLLYFVSFLAVAPTLIATSCTLLATNSSKNAGKCLIYEYVRIAHRTVWLYTHGQRIVLEHPSKHVLMYCGPYSETYSWEDTKKNGNQIRISFLQGYLYLQVYWCEDLNKVLKQLV